MNVIHIILGKANPNRMNGINRVVFELAAIQTEKGFGVQVFGLSNSQDNGDLKRPFRLKIFPRHRVYLDRKLILEIQAFENRNDVIFHIHGAFIYDFYLVVKLLSKCNSKYIYTSHGAFNRVAMEKSFVLKKIYFRLFERYILEHAYKVHLVAISEYQNVEVMCPKLKNKVLIPNGINTTDLTFDFKKIERNGALVICFCGRIDIQTKGLDILIEGFNQYVYQKGKGVLWIIGGGEELSALKGIVSQKGLDQQVVFYGPKFGKEKLNLIANADAFILTSRNDVFPLAVLEAGGLGKPLLVSKETNYGPYVNEYSCGFVLDQNTPLGVSSILRSFESLTMDELKNMQVNSKRMIDSEFDIESVSRKLLENRV